MDRYSVVQNALRRMQPRLSVHETQGLDAVHRATAYGEGPMRASDFARRYRKSAEDMRNLAAGAATEGNDLEARIFDNRARFEDIEADIMLMPDLPANEKRFEAARSNREEVIEEARKLVEEVYQRELQQQQEDQRVVAEREEEERTDRAAGQQETEHTLEVEAPASAQAREGQDRRENQGVRDPGHEMPEQEALRETREEVALRRRAADAERGRRADGAASMVGRPLNPMDLEYPQARQLDGYRAEVALDYRSVSYVRERDSEHVLTDGGVGVKIEDEHHLDYEAVKAGLKLAAEKFEVIYVVDKDPGFRKLTAQAAVELAVEDKIATSEMAEYLEEAKAEMERPQTQTESLEHEDRAYREEGANEVLRKDAIEVTADQKAMTSKAAPAIKLVWEDGGEFEDLAQDDSGMPIIEARPHQVELREVNGFSGKLDEERAVASYSRTNDPEEAVAIKETADRVAVRHTEVTQQDVMANVVRMSNEKFDTIHVNGSEEFKTAFVEEACRQGCAHKIDNEELLALIEQTERQLESNGRRDNVEAEDATPGAQGAEAKTNSEREQSRSLVSQLEREPAEMRRQQHLVSRGPAQGMEI